MGWNISYEKLRLGSKNHKPFIPLTQTVTLLSLFGCLTVTYYIMILYQPNKCSIKVESDRILHYVEDMFLSFSLDTSFINTGLRNFSNRHWELVGNMTKTLSPAYLRVGGSDADILIFHENYGHPSYITPEDFLKLFKFLEQTSLTLIFDFNVLLRKNGQWDSSNAKKILDFFEQHNIQSEFQLGNEPNSFKHKFNTSISGEQLGRDFKSLRSLLNSYKAFKSKYLVGPDVTNPAGHRSPPLPYLREFLNVSRNVLSAVTWHQYYFNGKDASLVDFLNPHEMDQLPVEIMAIKNEVDNHSRNLPIWLGETGSAYGGGSPNLSNTFVSTFLMLDKLGISAKLGIGVVIRQSLLKGNYALISDDLLPSPDFWVSYIYKRIVGNLVFDVSGACKNKNLRFYAHSVKKSFACLLGNEREPSTVVFGMNLGSDYANVKIEDFKVCAVFHLTSEGGNLQSKSVLLNNIKLDWPIDEIKGRCIPGRTSTITLPPFSLVFIVLY